MTQDDEDRQLRSLLSALGIVGEWEGLTGGPAPSGVWRPEDDSDLAGDDKIKRSRGLQRRCPGPRSSRATGNRSRPEQDHQLHERDGLAYLVWVRGADCLVGRLGGSVDHYRAERPRLEPRQLPIRQQSASRNTLPAPPVMMTASLRPS